MKLKDKRSRALEQVTDEMRRKIAEVEPGIEVEFPHVLEDLIGDLAWSPQPIEMKVYDEDEKTFMAVAHDIEEWLPKVKGVVDVVNRNVVIGPALNFRVDVEKAARAGFGVEDVAKLQAAILDGELASSMIKGDRQIGIRDSLPGARARHRRPS